MSSSRQRPHSNPMTLVFISDQSKGNINLYIGPYKPSLDNIDKIISDKDQFVLCELQSKYFEECSLESINIGCSRTKVPQHQPKEQESRAQRAQY